MLNWIQLHWQDIALPLSALANIALVLTIDRMRAQRSNWRYVMGGYIDRATAGRTPWIRAEAATIAKLFSLDNRTLPEPKQFNGKPNHPALRPPGTAAKRRRKAARQ
jgi:hypothetical protein